MDEMLRVIREDDPPTPSSRISTSDGLPGLAAARHIDPTRLSRFVKGDLDFTVMNFAKQLGRLSIDLAVKLHNGEKEQEKIAAAPRRSQ